MSFEIVQKDGKRFVYLPHVPQYLDRTELVQWMRDTRDDQPDLYAELVHAYMLLVKPLPHPKQVF
jgi:hypothetical protein